jgi:flavin reductase (DIM6/NTAB) family NADH-FMN oxidoreductase RutF
MKRSLGAKTIVYPTPVWVIGSYDKDNKPNMMTVAWGGVCSSNPPSVSISLRKATYSHGNITARKAFTVNVPSIDHVKEADHFGMVSGRNEDKIAKAKLTAVKSEKVDAPYIEEFPLTLMCKVIQVHEIGMHTQFIGEIVDVLADDSVMGKDGLPDLEKVAPLIFVPGSSKYYTTGKKIADAFSVGKTI